MQGSPCALYLKICSWFFLNDLPDDIDSQIDIYADVTIIYSCNKFDKRIMVKLVAHLKKKL